MSQDISKQEEILVPAVWRLCTTQHYACNVQVAAKKVQMHLRNRSREPAKVAAEKIQEALATQGELYLNPGPNQYAPVCGQSSNESAFDVHLGTAMLMCLAIVLSVVMVWMVRKVFAGLRYIIETVNEQNDHSHWD